MYILTLVLLGLYVAIVLLSAFLGVKTNIISTQNLIWTLVWSFMIVIFSITYTRTGNIYSLAGVAAGLFGYSSVALRNAQALRQKPQLKHHLIRMGIHLLFLALLYFTK
ncbi:hypothetical protein ACVR1I_03655 [Streptococcus cameli]